VRNFAFQTIRRAIVRAVLLRTNSEKDIRAQDGEGKVMTRKPEQELGRKRHLPRGKPRYLDDLTVKEKKRDKEEAGQA
jgi:hypothetical protein